jgi:CHAT domain-containing protein
LRAASAREACVAVMLVFGEDCAGAPVDSAATVKLTTSAFRILESDKKESDQKIGRAEAFRRAMLAMIDGAGKTVGTAYEAHPLYWASFVVIGEGGSGK